MPKAPATTNSLSKTSSPEPVPKQRQQQRTVKKRKRSVSPSENDWRTPDKTSTTTTTTSTAAAAAVVSNLATSPLEGPAEGTSASGYAAKTSIKSSFFAEKRSRREVNYDTDEERSLKRPTKRRMKIHDSKDAEEHDLIHILNKTVNELAEEVRIKERELPRLRACLEQLQKYQTRAMELREEHTVEDGRYFFCNIENQARQNARLNLYDRAYYTSIYQVHQIKSWARTTVERYPF